LASAPFGSVLFSVSFTVTFFRLLYRYYLSLLLGLS